MSNVSSKWVKQSFSEYSLNDQYFVRLSKDSVLSANVLERLNRYATYAFSVYEQIKMNVPVVSYELTIASEKSSDSKGKSNHYTRRKLSYRDVSCAFSWPNNGSEDKLKSSFAVGVLQIRIPAWSAVSSPSSIKDTLD